MSNILEWFLILVELGLFFFLAFMLLPAVIYGWIGTAIVFFISCWLLGIDMVYRQIQGRGISW